MKKLTLSFLAAAFTFAFSSCTSEENTLEDQLVAENLLKSYTLKRDKSGAYSIDYQLNGNAISESTSGTKKNSTKEIYLYSSDVASKTNFTEPLAIANDKLEVGFVDTNTGKQPKIIVLDNDIVFAKDDVEDYLASYGITGNDDNTYQLDFKVKENISVDFVYNEDEGIYEVHLEPGNATESDFSRTFEKQEGVDLKIDFVNHINDNSSKGFTSKVTLSKKPELIIQ